MIERLQVVNFQRHEQLRVKLDSRITTIVGPSDVGKSAVLRAIRWLAFNRPRGTGFVRHGETECSVRLWIDGRKVERRRTKSENLYLLDGRELKAVGTDVPEEVARLLNVTEENFQGQHDPPFWFCLTPGEVAKRLNAIVDLEVIDRSSSWLASRLRKVAAERDVIEKRKAEAEEERDGLSWVPMMAAELRLVEAASEKVSERRALAARLMRSVREVGIQVRKVEKSQRLAERGRKAVDAGEAARELAEKVRKLFCLLTDLGNAQERAEAIVPDVAALEGSYNRVEGKRRYVERLKNLLRLVRLSGDRLGEAIAAFNEAERDLAKKTEGICPVCGGPMKC